MTTINLIHAIANLIDNTRELHIDNNILMYFLTRNIETIFGKTIFSTEEAEITKIFMENNERELRIDIAGELYTICYTSKNELFLKNNANPTSFKISFEDTIISNFLIYIKDNNMITEYLDVSIGEEEFYDYKKTISTSDGQIINFPVHRLNSIGARIKDKVYYEIKTLEEEQSGSILKRIINNIKTNNLCAICISNSKDCFDYLDEIYKILEDKNHKQENIRRQ